MDPASDTASRLKDADLLLWFGDGVAPAYVDAAGASSHDAEIAAEPVCERGEEARVVSRDDATNEALAYCSGGMIERFTPDQGGPQLQALAAAGRLADVHAQYATDGIGKHLAAFLLFMGERSYFGAGGGWDGDGPTACSTWLREWPEYSRPLGAPLGGRGIPSQAEPCKGCLLLRRTHHCGQDH